MSGSEVDRVLLAAVAQGRRDALTQPYQRNAPWLQVRLTRRWADRDAVAEADPHRHTRHPGAPGLRHAMVIILAVPIVVLGLVDPTGPAPVARPTGCHHHRSRRNHRRAAPTADASAGCSG